MYIDNYNINVVSQDYHHKKEKYINNINKLNLKSNQGMHHKKFIPMLEELFDANDGCEIEFDIKIKQHQYEE